MLTALPNPVDAKLRAEGYRWHGSIRLDYDAYLAWRSDGQASSHSAHRTQRSAKDWFVFVETRVNRNALVRFVRDEPVGFSVWVKSS